MKNKKGFSLTELLTTATILLTLSSVSIISYKKYKKKGSETWVKTELATMSRILKSAFLMDGGYHQFIYQAGYRPQGTQQGAVSLPSQTTGTKACCDMYPDIGVSPCTGGFLHYNCGNTAAEKALSNKEICDALPENCEIDSSLTVDHKKPLGNAKGGGNIPAPDSNCKAKVLHTASKSWCDCDEFTLVGRTKYDSYYSLNQSDILCFKEEVTDKLEP